MIGIIALSCDNNDSAYYPVPSDFSVSPNTEQSLGVDGGTIKLIISAGNLGWWIESSVDWCKSSQKYGSGDGEVIITVPKNTTASEREAIITVNPTFKKKPVIIKIKQQC